MRLAEKVITAIVMLFSLAICTGAVAISDFSGITDLGGAYELASDVVLGADFESVGSESEPFTGTLDGKGFTVKGENCGAVFSFLEDATVKNLNVEITNLITEEYFGGIALAIKGSSVIENCRFTGSVSVKVSGIYACGGGIAGFVDEDAVISGCGADITLDISKKPYILSVGAIAGENRGTVEYCYSAGSLAASSDRYKINIGGIVGENKGTVRGCFNEAEISGKISAESAQMFAGGIAGVNNGGEILRSANLCGISGAGITLYPAYVGGIAGMNVNGSISIAKNGANLALSKSFGGGITGFNLGHKSAARMSDIINTGTLSGADSVTGGVVGKNTVTDREGSVAALECGLNLSGNKALAENTGTVSDVYNTGAEDGITTQKNAEVLVAEGIPELEKHSLIWVNNTVVSALPDMLIAYNEEKPSIIVSNKGSGGDIAYYFYSPTAGAYAESFTAVYYNGSRYIGMTYTESVQAEKYARLRTEDIPENTTRIKFIAFADSFGEGFVPAAAASVEIAYTK